MASLAVSSRGGPGTPRTRLSRENRAISAHRTIRNFRTTGHCIQPSKSFAAVASGINILRGHDSLSTVAKLYLR